MTWLRDNNTHLNGDNKMKIGENMNKEQQVKVMETHLGNFDSLMEKMQYMSMMFDPDPEFTKEARDIVRGNICKALPRV